MAQPPPQAIEKGSIQTTKSPKSSMSETRRPHFHNKQQGKASYKTAWMKKAAGAQLHTISAPSIEPSSTPVSSTAGFETLCSYNWQNDGRAIIVPGGPPKWTPPPLPTTLTPDAGYSSPHTSPSHLPRYPFLPIFQALAVTAPDAQLDSVDIILNRNSLRKLLDFCAGKRPDPFCMGLQMVHKTLFISRKERNARSMIYGAPNSGYGHSFEGAFTTCEEGLQGTGSHHRVIRYRLGGLECVVRFEVDAYYEDEEARTQDKDAVAAPVPASMHHLTTSLAHLDVKNPPPKGTTSVLLRGTPIPASQLAEIKARKGLKRNEAMPQLWFGRTPYLLVGKHVNGVVETTTCSHAEAQFVKWETANQDKLRKLVSLLMDLKRVVGETKQGAVVLVYEERGGKLEVYEGRGEMGVLPKDVIAKHWGKSEG